MEIHRFTADIIRRHITFARTEIEGVIARIVVRKAVIDFFQVAKSCLAVNIHFRNAHFAGAAIVFIEEISRSYPVKIRDIKPCIVIADHGHILSVKPAAHGFKIHGSADIVPCQVSCVGIEHEMGIPLLYIDGNLSGAYECFPLAVAVVRVGFDDGIDVDVIAAARAAVRNKYRLRTIHLVSPPV